MDYKEKAKHFWKGWAIGLFTGVLMMVVLFK